LGNIQDNSKKVPGDFFPFCPQPSRQWRLDWETMQQRFSWLQAMDGVLQFPAYHAEGDVLIHTHMVTDALIQHTQWRALPDEERTLLFASALLHDVGKPACTKIESDGKISSRGHARRGEFIARRILWTGEELPAPVPFTQCEYIARLVRWHGLPLQFLKDSHPEKLIIAASQSIRMDHLALLAEADVRGRICADQEELLERVELFRLLCQEQNCYTTPYSFPTPHSRFVYLHSEHSYPDYNAYDDTAFEVILLSGLPGSGKNSWLQTHLSDWPVISLDSIRKELHVTPDGDQGHVIQLARERAREYMRKQQSFAWNATNTTRLLRQQLIDLFTSYGGRTHIVYLTTPYDVIIKQNRDREASVPETIISKLLAKLEVPDITEAHQVEWVNDRR
jgi:predicted kinase